MATSSRSARSNAAPAGRESSSSSRTQQRPQLQVVTHRGTATDKARRSIAGIWAWTKTRSTPVMHIVIAVAFLGACLLGALLLRTQMSSNSFEASSVEQNISVLQQDIEDDQAKLSKLEATLPERAQKMNMVPSQGSLSIDLNGYKPSEEETR